MLIFNPHPAIPNRANQPVMPTQAVTAPLQPTQLLAPPGAQRNVPSASIARARPGRSPNRATSANDPKLPQIKAPVRAAPKLPPSRSGSTVASPVQPTPPVPVQPAVQPVQPPAGFTNQMLQPNIQQPPKLPTKEKILYFYLQLNLSSRTSV